MIMADVLPTSLCDFSNNHSETHGNFPYLEHLENIADSIDSVSPISNNRMAHRDKTLSSKLLDPSDIAKDCDVCTTINGNNGNEYTLKEYQISNIGEICSGIKLHPASSQTKDKEIPYKPLCHGNSKEVTYTVNDEIGNVSNQVILLPPPPSNDIDSDNDSIVGCDVVGPCSPRHLDWRDSRDFTKSPTSRTAPGSSRCLCCMLLIFILSTAGLSTVLVLMYMGKVEFASTPKSRPFVGQGRIRLGDGALIREVCETSECLKTSSSILSRMNKTADPCEDFYSYACGGYAKEVDLSWFRTRIREHPDDVIHEHKRFIVDRLSESFDFSDDKLMKSAKNIYRSCLFRSKGLDSDARSIVSDIFDALGGLKPSSTDSIEFTHLLANVTRMFGASPFFKVVVHTPNTISLISQLSAYINPGSSSRDFSRQKLSKHKNPSVNISQLKDIIIYLINGSVTTAEAKSMVNNFFRLEKNIRRILTSEKEHLGLRANDNIDCDEPGRQKLMDDLQVNYGGYGIDWFLFLESLMETADVSKMKLCRVRLSMPLQQLLEITPKSVLRQFILIYTLIHSDLRMFFAKTYDDYFYSKNYPLDIGETEEDKCLKILLHFMPSLERFAGCDESVVARSRVKTFSTISTVRSVLYDILTDSLNIPKENAASVTNLTANQVIRSVSKEIVSRCQFSYGPQGTFSEYNFTSNMLKIIQYHNGEYYQGRLLHASKDLELLALWISSSVLDDHRAKAGPIMYSSPIPQPVLYGSLGSFLASRFADRLSIDDLLDHHSNGLLTDSTVLTLAVRLKCLVNMYKDMNILDFGSQVYKIDGELTKGLQWKDQLALKLSYKAWIRSETISNTDHFITGLIFSRPQLFFLSYTQTMCEKVSARGLLKFYVSDESPPAIPSHQRVNGILRNSDEFTRAFQCHENTYMNPLKKCHIF